MSAKPITENDSPTEEGWIMVQSENKKHKKNDKKNNSEVEQDLQAATEDTRVKTPEPIEEDFVIVNSKALKALGIKLLNKRKRRSDEYKIIEIQDIEGLNPKPFTIGRSNEQLVDELAAAADESDIPKVQSSYATAVLNGPKAPEEEEEKKRPKKNRKNKKGNKTEEVQASISDTMLLAAPLLHDFLNKSQPSFESKEKSLEYSCPDGPKCSGVDEIVDGLEQNEITLSHNRCLSPMRNQSNTEKPVIDNFKVSKNYKSSGSKKRLKCDKAQYPSKTNSVPNNVNAVTIDASSKTDSKEIPTAHLENNLESKQKSKHTKENVAQNKENIEKSKTKSENQVQNNKDKSSTNTEKKKKSKGKHKRNDQNKQKKNSEENDATEELLLHLKGSRCDWLEGVDQAVRWREYANRKKNKGYVYSYHLLTNEEELPEGW